MICINCGKKGQQESAWLGTREDKSIYTQHFRCPNGHNWTDKSEVTMTHDTSPEWQAFIEEMATTCTFVRVGWMMDKNYGKDYVILNVVIGHGQLRVCFLSLCDG